MFVAVNDGSVVIFMFVFFLMKVVLNGTNSVDLLNMLVLLDDVAVVAVVLVFALLVIMLYSADPFTIGLCSFLFVTPHI